MDFGDILAQWGEQQKKEKLQKKSPQIQKSSKKANAGEPSVKTEQNSSKNTNPVINPMELWLRRYGVTDKDSLAQKSESALRMENREYLRTMRPEARIDLHGNTRDEAWARLESFVNDCLQRGLRKIEIVHGKGIHSRGSDPVLGNLVRMFIEQNKHLGTSGHNDKNHGGSGVTWVLLK